MRRIPAAILRSHDKGKSWQVFPVSFRMGGNEDGRGLGERLAIDPTGPHVMSYKQNRYCLTVIDCFSRYLWVIPIRNKITSTVVKALTRHVFAKVGICEQIHSDRGKSSALKL